MRHTGDQLVKHNVLDSREGVFMINHHEVLSGPPGDRVEGVAVSVNVTDDIVQQYECAWRDEASAATGRMWKPKHRPTQKPNTEPGRQQTQPTARAFRISEPKKVRFKLKVRFSETEPEAYEDETANS